MTASLRYLVVLLFAGLAGGNASDVAGEWMPAPETGSTTLTGKFLVATPELSDPNFREAVIYLMHHDSAGAMGVVINRLLAQGPMGKLLEAFGIEGDPGGNAQIRVLYGGPVESGSSLVLHPDDYHNTTTTEIGNHLAVSSSDDVLTDFAKGQGPGSSLLILGYAGWAADQLENEIASGAWYVVTGDQDLLFDEDIATKWKRALTLRGVQL